MISNNFYESNKDLQYIVDNFVDWNRITSLKEMDFADARTFAENGDSRYEFAPSNPEEALEGYKAAWTQYGEIFGKRVAPEAQKLDKEGLKFSNGKVTFPAKTIEFTELVIQSGLLGYAVSRHYGGLHMPLTAQMVIMEVIGRADAALGITLGCYNLAEVIERFGDQKMKDEWLPRMVSGDVIGAMALTEPNHGSDLSNILTRAEKTDTEGLYLITGTKRFITHGCGLGDRPSAILTLARSGGSGAKGLSFFLVDGRGVEVARIEEKMGLHCSPTCEIVYDKSPAILIGEEGRGLVKYAMEMMNGARLAIAIQALGISEAAYREAEKYANERIQFGKPIIELPPVRRSIREMKAKVEACRAMVYRTAEFVDILDGLSEKMKHEGIDEREIRRHEEVIRYDKLAKLMTPSAKLFCSEIANKVAYEALQIFGGSGYTEEYDVARIYRDARITTIYEGTSNLQVVAAIGGIVEGLRDSAVLREYWNERLDSLADRSMKSYLTTELRNLTEMVRIYKEQDKEQKDANAQDLVWYHCWLFNTLMMAESLLIARVRDPEYAVEKEATLETWMNIVRRELAALGSSFLQPVTA